MTKSDIGKATTATDMTKCTYHVTGDHSRMVYSRHTTEQAALRAARALARRWGWSHPGAEPQVVHDDGRVLHVVTSERS